SERMEPECGRVEAGAVTIALAEANQKRGEAEAAARAAEEKARRIEALLIETEAVAHEATERHNAAEARLEYEIKQRASAEQKLKEFEDELSSYLELDWSKSDPDITQASPARDGFVTNEHPTQLLSQLEHEPKPPPQAHNPPPPLDLT